MRIAVDKKNKERKRTLFLMNGTRLFAWKTQDGGLCRVLGKLIEVFVVRDYLGQNLRGTLKSQLEMAVPEKAETLRSSGTARAL